MNESVETAGNVLMEKVERLQASLRNLSNAQEAYKLVDRAGDTTGVVGTKEEVLAAMRGFEDESAVIAKLFSDTEISEAIAAGLMNKEEYRMANSPAVGNQTNDAERPDVQKLEI